MPVVPPALTRARVNKGLVARAHAITSLVAILVAVFSSALPTPRAALPATQAQSKAEPPLNVTLFSDTVGFRTVPQTSVTAELVRPDGQKAAGIGFAGEDGLATVTFFAGGDPSGSGAGGPPVVRPGDRIVLSRDGARPLEFSVPSYSADIDVATDQVIGTAPAGAQVEVDLTYGADASTTTISRTVSSTAGGTWSLSFAGEIDLQPGAAWGTASFTDAEHFRYAAQFAALSADFTLGARGMRGRATPGTRVGLAVHQPGGGSRRFAPVEVVNGINYVVGAGGGAAGPSGPVDPGGPGGPGQEPAAPIMPGDTVAVTTTVAARSPGRAQSLGARIEPMAIGMNASTDRVSGTGPADIDMIITAESMENQALRLITRTDAAGAFDVPTGSQADLGAGWRVRAAYEASPGLWVGAIAVAPKVRIGVDLPLGQGRAEPGQAVTLTLRSAAGGVKSRQVTIAGDLGDYSWSWGLGSGGRPVPQPGDEVEIAYVTGDSTFLGVPRLTARSDVAGDAVRGEAPAGALIRAQVDGVPSATGTAVAGDDGGYRAPLGGFDLERPAGGAVYLTLPSGHELFTTWAASRLIVMPGNTMATNFVFGNGPRGRAIRAELIAPGGQVVASASTEVFSGSFVFIGGGGGASGVGSQFFVNLADITGTPVNMRPGDTLRVVAGDETTEVPIPPLDAVVFVQQDTVAGHSLPGTVVHLTVARGMNGVAGQAETTADASGNFSHGFSGQVDIQYGDIIQLAAEVEGHVVQTSVIAPGLTLDLDSASLLGSLAPDAQVTITLARAGRPIAEATTLADDGGLVAIQLSDANGAPLVIQPGDVITAVPKRPPAETLTLTVPELTIAWDAVADTVGGRATPGGAITLLALDAYPRQGALGFAQAWPELPAGGAFTAEFVPGVDVRPGSRFTALYRPPAGHYVQRTRTVPILSAEHGGPNLCGFADVRADVTASLLGATGRQAAAASARARFDGYFDTLWRRGTGSQGADLVISENGQAARARLGTQGAEVALPELNLRVDWQTGQLTGIGPSNQPFFIGPAQPCPRQQLPNGVDIRIGGFGFGGRTRADGTLEGFVPDFLLAPGSGVEVAFYADSDHRYFRTLYRTLGRVFVRSAQLGGQANALQPITAILKDAGGTERGRLQTTADASGAFAGEFRSSGGSAGPTGGPVSSRPGDTVVLRVSGDEVAIPVEDLSFDWSPGENPVIGRAPAGRTVALLLRLADGREFQLPRTADASGAFSFTPAELPPRADWSLRDVAGLRIVLTTPNGHQVIDQTASFDSASEPAGRRLFMPVAYNRVGTAGVGRASGSRGQNVGNVVRCFGVNLFWSNNLRPVLDEQAWIIDSTTGGTACQPSPLCSACGAWPFRSSPPSRS